MTNLHYSREESQCLERKNINPLDENVSVTVNKIVNPLSAYTDHMTIFPYPEQVLVAIKKVNGKLPQEKLIIAIETIRSTNLKVLPRPALDYKAKIMIVWRGLRMDQLFKMVAYGSAGGIPVNNNANQPSEASVKDQVGERISLPEFTSSVEVAEHFGTGHVVAVFEAAMKFFVIGSASEQGFVCNPEAPVKLIGWQLGRQFISSSPLKAHGYLHLN